MVRDILLIQKRELETKLKEKFIERSINYNKFESDLIKVIIGPRRAGKSFLGFHILNKMGNFGYVNFDDERLIDVKDYDEIINAVNSIYNAPKYLLLDEIQNLAKWELFINRLQRQGFNLLITGSNSKLLSKELATHLTGRHLLINIFPFSFPEFLKLGEIELTIQEIKDRLFEYLTYGGYPEPWLKNMDHKDYLSTLFNSVIYKDIIKRFNIRLTPSMEDLALYLISNIAKEFSYNTLIKVTKCRSTHTVERYLGYLEETFLVFKIDRFSFRFRERISSNKKIYCIDNGLIYAKAFKVSPDFGRLYENIVAVRLKKDEMEGKHQIYYWKNPQHEEVDFVIKEAHRVTRLIQVCYDIVDPRTKEREERALIKASKELGCKDLLIVTQDYEGEESFKWFGMKEKIRFIPLWKWLLE